MGGLCTLRFSKADFSFGGSMLTFHMQDFECVKTKKQWKSWLARMNEAKTICFDTETTGLDTFVVDLVGFAFAIQEGDRIEACYVPVRHQKNLGKTLDIGDVLDDIAKLLNTGKPIVMANALYDMLVMRQPRNDVRIQNVHDTQLMSYALTGNQHYTHGMDALAERILNYKTIKFKDVVDPKIGVPDFSYVRLDVATKYSAEDAAVTLLIAKVLQQQLKKEGLWRLYEADRRLLPVLCNMKLRGIAVDFKRLEYLGAEFKASMWKLEEKAYKQAGLRWNLRSSPQTAELLYGPKTEGGLGIAVAGYTDGGAPAADRDTLEQIVGVPVVDTILEFKQFATLVSTFCDGLPEKRNPLTGRVHTDLKITTTKTRRFASAGPNLQNIPTRTEQGKEVRHAFVAGNGNVLISCDFSQIEYRVLAHVTEDPRLIEAYANKVDLHAQTAAWALGGSWQDYVNEKDAARYKYRGVFKNVAFATVYGAGPNKIARMSKIELSEAYRLLDLHRELFVGVYAWKETTWEFARQHKYVANLFGGRTHVPYINSGNSELKGSAERLAVNAPIQGGAAELIRLSMPSVDRIERSQLLLQVHDELVLECRETDADRIVPLVKEAMETAADEWVEWRVPIIANAKVGKTWGELK